MSNNDFWWIYMSCVCYVLHSYNSRTYMRSWTMIESKFGCRKDLGGIIGWKSYVKVGYTLLYRYCRNWVTLTIYLLFVWHKITSLLVLIGIYYLHVSKLVDKYAALLRVLIALFGSLGYIYLTYVLIINDVVVIMCYMLKLLFDWLCVGCWYYII